MDKDIQENKDQSKVSSFKEQENQQDKITIDDHQTKKGNSDVFQKQVKTNEQEPQESQQSSKQCKTPQLHNGYSNIKKHRSSKQLMKKVANQKRVTLNENDITIDNEKNEDDENEFHSKISKSTNNDEVPSELELQNLETTPRNDDLDENKSLVAYDNDGNPYTKKRSSILPGEDHTNLKREMTSITNLMRNSMKKMVSKKFSEIDKDEPIQMSKEMKLRIPSEKLDKDLLKRQHNKGLEHEKQIFDNLTDAHKFSTQMNEVINLRINKQSTKVIVLTMVSNKEYKIGIYKILSHQLEREIQIKGSFIKADLIERNHDGTKYAVAFMDDGAFKLLIFNVSDKDNTKDEDEDKFINISEKVKQEVLGHLKRINTISQKNHEIDKSTMPISGFFNPFATCTFLSDNLENKVYYQFFHRQTKQHWQCIVDIDQDYKLIDVHNEQITNSDQKNFPQNSFYNNLQKQIHTVYREGHIFTSLIQQNDEKQDNDIKSKANSQKNSFISQDNQNPKEEEKSKQLIGEKYIENLNVPDIGAVVMWKSSAGSVLIARSSSRVLFFKQIINKLTKRHEWKEYHLIKSTGFVSINNKLSLLQIIEQDYVKIYSMEETTNIPKLKNVMTNFMECTQIEFGDYGIFAIIYKVNHCDFTIYQKKYNHSFHSQVKDEDYENSNGIHLPKSDMVLVAKPDGQVEFFNYLDYEEEKHINFKIKMPDTDNGSNQKTQVLSINSSEDGKVLVAFLGIVKIGDDVDVQQIVRFEKNEQTKRGETTISFSESNRIMIEPSLNQFNQEFVFEKKQLDTIIVCSKLNLISLKIGTDELQKQSKFKFSKPLQSSQNKFQFNHDQKAALVYSDKESYVVNLEQKSQIQLNKKLNVSQIKNAICIGQQFYIIANKRNNKIGFYLFRQDINVKQKSSDESEDIESQFLINFQNKLDIRDVDMFVFDKNAERKELIISYKSIYFNKHHILLVDCNTSQIMIQHETFCLWEREISSFFNEYTKHIIVLKAQGIYVSNLSKREKHPNVIEQENGKVMKNHNLHSSSHLKFSLSNTIVYKRRLNDYEIQVRHAYKDRLGQTKYETIFQTKINDIAIRDLLLIESFYFTVLRTDFVSLIQQQGDPSIFYDSSFELQRQNLVTILSYDSEVTKILLEDKFTENYHQREYPLIFMCQKKSKYRNKGRQKIDDQNYTAIDISRSYNQIRGIQIQVDFISKYQNHYTSSKIFNSNFIELMNLGVRMSEVLKGNIFKFQFYYDWPHSHLNNEKMYVPYNDCIFNLRGSYDSLFPTLGNPVEVLPQKMMHDVEKIQYHVNLLFNIKPKEMKKDDDISLISSLSKESDQLEIFESPMIQEMLDYKWNVFAYKIHYINFINHLIYVIILTIHTLESYVIGDYGIRKNNISLILLCISLIYPIYYQITFFCIIGFRNYFSESWNIIDQIFIWSSIVCVIIKFTDEDDSSTLLIFLMQIVLILTLLRSLQFLRIFNPLTKIIALVQRVTTDLTNFMCFYLIIIFFFSLNLVVLGFDNPDARIEKDRVWPPNEYGEIGKFAANVITVIRFSIGDNNFDTVYMMREQNQRIFWIIYAIIVYLTIMILLNFLIAETQASYETISGNLENFLHSQRVRLINESEIMQFRWLMSKSEIPKYLVVRNVSR